MAVSLAYNGERQPHITTTTTTLSALPRSIDQMSNNTSTTTSPTPALSIKTEAKRVWQQSKRQESNFHHVCLLAVYVQITCQVVWCGVAVLHHTPARQNGHTTENHLQICCPRAVNHAIRLCESSIITVFLYPPSIHPFMSVRPVRRRISARATATLALNSTLLALLDGDRKN